MSGYRLDLEAILSAADPMTPEAWTQQMRDDAFVLHARVDVPALVAEVRRLMALVPQPAPPGVVIVSWSGKRHIALPGSRVQRDGSKRALCSEYTWGLEPDADGDVLRGVKEGKRAEILPMCKSCTRLAAS